MMLSCICCLSSHVQAMVSTVCCTSCLMPWLHSLVVSKESCPNRSQQQDSRATIGLFRIRYPEPVGHSEEEYLYRKVCPVSQKYPHGAGPTQRRGTLDIRNFLSS